MKLKDNPLLYLAILYFIFRFTWFMILLQFALFVFSLGSTGLSLTYFLSCAILLLCEEYVIRLLIHSNFDYEASINEHDKQ